MQRVPLSDEAIVDQARRAVAAKRNVRWLMLLNAAFFLGLCGYFTFAGIRKIENLDAEQLTVGFVYGLVLAFAWATFGVLGGLFLGKFLVGLGADFRLHELVICYHDRLRDLGQLPDDRGGEKAGAVGGSQPIGSQTNRTSSPPGSHG